MQLCENPACQKELVRKSFENPKRFAKRRFCSNKCSAACKPKDMYDRISQSRKAFEQTPEGKASRKSTVDGHKEWRLSNPDEFKELTDRQTASRNQNNHGQKVSEWTANFYETEEGKARKERFSQLYKGKKRPPLIRENIRAGIRQFWDSPEGYKLREAISQRMTDNLPDPPYGPGWGDARYRARQRDKWCVLCFVSSSDIGKELPVHHIYRKRMFGYIPGQNQNYKWANNLANLITLCPTCHRRVEMHVVNVPDEYQQNADELWSEFLVSQEWLD